MKRAIRSRRTPTGPPTGPSAEVKTPGKFANRQRRRKLQVDTEASAKILNEIGIKFMMAIQDPRAESYTYEEIFHGYEREFTARIRQINEHRESSRLLLDPFAFRDTYGPIERDLSPDGLLEWLRGKFINPLFYEVHPEPDQSPLFGDEEANEEDQAGDL